MADNLIFPIGFDLESAVKKASTDWDGKYADQLEKAIQKRAIEIKLSLSAKSFDSLDDVKRRLAELKLEPITPETKTAIRELAAELRTLAKALEQVQKYSTAKSAASPDAVRAARINEISQRTADKAAIAHEKQREAAQKVLIAEEKLALARTKSARAADKATAGVNNLTKAYNNQTAYIDRLLQRMVATWSIQRVQHFITSVREVTAEFELQRVSLGAIIQDQNRANQLFSEIKQFALKSPVSILDLTKYTKQIAAYRIETDKLFDTTKRLADVSVGLGVDMGRIVLAYGQVKAASYLRAAEIRQFTEAGIPMLELLAEKFTKLNGEMVTTEQVMEMVSKRGVQFSMVEEIFNDMTSAGGMFYNMQEKQGNTLYGMWAKLGDAASVMYDQIGNTSWVKEGMQSAIQLLTTLMREWKSIGKTILVVGPSAFVLAAAMKGVTAATAAQTLAVKKNTLSHIANRLELIKKSTRLRMTYRLLRNFGMSMNQATAYTITFSKAIKLIGAVSMGALTLGIGFIVEKLFQAYENAHRLKNALDEIEAETTVEQGKSVRNFEYLANAATDVKKSYKERKDALDELQRTYKEILPQEVLVIEYLNKLRGNYASLTNTIREYIAEQQRRKAIDTISEEFGAKKLKYERDTNVFFREQGWSEQEIARFWEQFYKSAADKSKTLQQVVMDAVAKGGNNGVAIALKLLASQKDWTKDFNKKTFNSIGLAFFGGVDKVELLRDAVIAENQELEQYEARCDAAAAASSRFAAAQAKLAERMANVTFFHADGKKEVDRDSFLGEQMMKNFEIKGIAEFLKTEFEGAEIEWNDGFANLISKIDESKPELISALDFTAIINHITETLNSKSLTTAQRELLTNLLTTARQAQQRYMEIVPSDPVVRTWQQRFRIIANEVSEFRTQYNQYLMQSGEDLETYNKRLKDSLESLKNNVKGLLATQKLVIKAGVFAKLLYGVSAEELKQKMDEENEKIKIIEKVLGEQPNFDKKKSKGGKGSKQDPRLQNLKEEISLVQKLYQEYKQLEKQEGGAKAAEDMRRLAATTIDTLKKKYGFDLPTSAKDVASALEILYQKMEALSKESKKSKKVFPGIQKDLDELRWTIEKVKIDDMQAKIEKKLKELSDRISRTKTAKEFYEKILSQTGNFELAANVSFAIYGEDGKDLNEEIRQNIQEMLSHMTEETVDGKKIQKIIRLDFSRAVREDGSIDYDILEDIASKYLALEQISEDTYKNILKMRDDNRKDLAKTVQEWMKAVDKAKSYSDKLLDLTRTTEMEIARINTEKSHTQARIDSLLAGEQTDATQAEIERLRALLGEYDEVIAGFRRKRQQEAAALDYEEFKNSEQYVHVFENLENASTSTLTNLKKRLEDLKASWVNPERSQVKDIQQAIESLDEQLAKRNPFKTLIENLREYRRLRTSGDERGNKSAKAADADMDRATERFAKARKEYEQVLAQYGQEGETFEQLMQRYANSNTEASQEILNAKNEFDEALADKEAAERAVKNWKKVKDAIGLSATEIFQLFGSISEAARGIATMAEALGADENDVQYFNDVADALDQISSGIENVVQAAMSGNVIGVVTSAISAIPNMFAGFVNLFSASKVRKANKEIERQQDILDQLEYTYNRLQTAADKLFGTDYINNYNQQLKIMNAQAEAYRKQAEAERSKGKKADKDKIKDYKNSYRDMMDEIADMEQQLTEKFTGSSRTDAAKQFVQSWIEAKTTFANTKDAILSDYKDLIQNMVIEGAAAKVIDNILAPMWDNMDKLLEKNDIDGAIDYLVNGMDKFVTQADDGMNTLWKALEARGYDMQKLLGDTDTNLTGISRDIASASEESINGLAAGINTQNSHLSQVPGIAANVAAMRALMEAGNGQSLTPAIDMTSLWNQHLALQQGIYEHTRRSAEKCEAMAIQCAQIAEDVHKVIVPRGKKGTFQVYVGM